VEPTAQDEQDDQTKGLCMGTPTRHGLRWPLKDLKDTPSHFLSQGLFESHSHQMGEGRKAMSLKK